MSSVGESYAILSGRLTGNSAKAQHFLNNMTRDERIMRGRSESRAKKRLRKRGYRMGDTRRGRN